MEFLLMYHPPAARMIVLDSTPLCQLIQIVYYSQCGSQFVISRLCMDQMSCVRALYQGLGAKEIRVELPLSLSSSLYVLNVQNIIILWHLILICRKVVEYTFYEFCTDIPGPSLSKFLCPKSSKSKFTLFEGRRDI